MSEKLFVYGTLRPGQSNEHVLAGIGGRFQAASIRGHLYPEGCVQTEGFPYLLVDEQADAVNGLLFESDHLAQNWPMLDAFEGAGYRRIRVQVQTAAGSESAWMYTLN